MSAETVGVRVQNAGRALGRREIALFALLAATILLLFGLSLAVGHAAVPLFASLGDLMGGERTLGSLVIGAIRLPRTLLGLAVGASLGLTGAALQGLLRNPLAEPGLVGISGLGALGAVLVFYFGAAAAFPFALPLGGLAGSFLAVLFIQLLAGRYGGALTLILAGIAVNSLAAALTALALNLAPNPFAITEILFWLLGSLADRSMSQVTLAVPLMAAGWLLLLSLGRGLDALTLGEDVARSLGVDLPRLRLKLVLGAALSVGAAVSVAGSIGFVGLVVPHLLRPLVGHRPGLLCPASALGGAALTLAADIAVRLVDTGTELRLGVFTALIGAPFFLWLVVRARREAL